jgi:hypothetical protein
MWIEEAGRDHQIRGVDHLFGGVLDFANFRDATAGHADVRGKAWASGSVHHRSIFDEQVQSHRLASPVTGRGAG